MQDDIKRNIHSAILLVLRPIARALLRGGVGYREFSEISKAAFVDVATSDYGLRGRPTNVSRVAVMTGLTRKEVRRIRERDLDGDHVNRAKDTPIAQILHRWHTDTEFLSAAGEPLPLDFLGDSKSFASLVRKYGGDVPPGAMRTELERINAIEVLDDDQLRPTKRIAYNMNLHERLSGGLTKILYPAALNLAHNLQRSDNSEWWSNLVTHTKYLRDNDRGRYMRISNDRISEFAKSIDDMQAGFESLYDENVDGDPSEGRSLGIGIFYFEEDKSDSNFFE
jgi:hypothetical protein